jgi:hypothetical protein
MSGTIANVLITVAVLALVVSRQFRARRVGTDRRVWVLPLVLAALALRDPHLVDPAHRTAAVALLAAGVLLAGVSGCVWGWTTRVWREADGTVWSRGTRVTVAAWAGTLLLRAGLYGLGSGLGVRQNSQGLLLTVAALLLARGAVVAWRARTLEPTYRVPAAG